MKRDELGPGRTLALGLAGFLFALGCGGDTDSATQALHACEDVVDAYARSWDRCGRASYEEAQQIFTDAFGCDQYESHDDASLDGCITDLDALTCNDVTAGTTPASCQGLVAR